MFPDRPRTEPREMITSPDNEKLKTVTKLRRRKVREKLGLFLTEGEDLASAGLSAGFSTVGLTAVSWAPAAVIASRLGVRE